MQKITVVTGKQASGKTVRAMQLAADKNAIWSNHLDYELLRENLTDSTGLIVLDDIVDLKQTLRNVEELATKEFIMIRKPYESIRISYTIPEIILVTQDPREAFPLFFQQNANFISL